MTNISFGRGCLKMKENILAGNIYWMRRLAPINLGCFWQIKTESNTIFSGFTPCFLIKGKTREGQSLAVPNLFQGNVLKRKITRRIGQCINTKSGLKI